MKSKNPNEEALRYVRQQGSQAQQQDDKVVYSVVNGDKETIVAESIRELVWVRDPANPDILMPKTIFHQKCHLASHGKAVDYRHAVSCKEGCTVDLDSIYRCVVCRKRVCIDHSRIVGRTAYCRTGFCGVVSIIHKIFRVIYIIIRFCYRSIIGLDTKLPKDDNTPEREFFKGREDPFDMIKEEGTDDRR